MQTIQSNQIRLNQLLLKIIKSKDYFPSYYMKLDSILKNLNLSFDHIFTVNQNGGSKHTFETTINSYTYYINYHTSNTDPNNKLIFIYRQSASNQTYDESLDSEYTDTKHCALLSYSDPDIIHIILINSKSDCFRSNNPKKIEKYGSTLLKIIKRFAKTKGFKKIMLEDSSNFYCKDEHNLKFDLSKGRVLTDGLSFYAKYGFKYVDKKIESIYANNKSIMDNLKTSDIDLGSFIKLVFINLIPTYQIFNNKDFIADINLILNLYTELYNKPLYEFMKNISYNCCVIFSLIINDLFKFLNLDNRDGAKMYFDLTST